MLKNLTKYDLDNGANGGNNGSDDKKPETGAEKKYTQDDVNKMMAAKDHEVSAKFESQITDLKNQLEQAKKDAYQDGLTKGEERAKMSAEERAKAELADERKQIEADKQKVEADKKQQAHAKQVAKIKEALEAKGVPTYAADSLIDEDPEKQQANVDNAVKEFQAALEKQTTEKLKGTKNPQNGVAINSGKITKDQFDRMSLEEQTQLYRTNPDLYKQLAY